MKKSALSSLPLESNSADAVFSCHVIEHLYRADVPKAFAEVHRILKPGGIFRSVLPDLLALARAYVADDREDAALRFLGSTHLRRHTRPRGVMGILRAVFGHSDHLWMWDYRALRLELLNAGFTKVREAKFGDSAVPEIVQVEDRPRFDYAVCFEAQK